jgi:hypothetical protein
MLGMGSVEIGSGGSSNCITPRASASIGFLKDLTDERPPKKKHHLSSDLAAPVAGQLLTPLQYAGASLAVAGVVRYGIAEKRRVGL